MVAEFLLKLQNKKLKQPNQLSPPTSKEIATVWRSLYFPSTKFYKLTVTVVYMLTSPLQACAPVAQRIEHLPCWSLNEE